MFGAKILSPHEDEAEGEAAAARNLANQNPTGDWAKGWTEEMRLPAYVPKMVRRNVRVTRKTFRDETFHDAPRHHRVEIRVPVSQGMASVLDRSQAVAAPAEFDVPTSPGDDRARGRSTRRSSSAA